MKSRWYYPFMSWLELLNFFVLQWLFIRLQGEYDEETGKPLRWSIIGLIWPLTGWWTDYRYVWKRRSRLTRTLVQPSAITLVRELVSERTAQTFHEAAQDSPDFDEEDCCDGTAQDHKDCGDRLEASLEWLFKEKGI